MTDLDWLRTVERTGAVGQSQQNHASRQTWYWLLSGRGMANKVRRCVHWLIVLLFAWTVWLPTTAEARRGGWYQSQSSSRSGGSYRSRSPRYQYRYKAPRQRAYKPPRYKPYASKWKPAKPKVYKARWHFPKARKSFSRYRAPRAESPYKKYRREVDRLSNQTYRDHQSSIDPGRRRGKRGRMDLDHILPVKKCYERGMSAEQCASRANLRMLDASRNRSEGCRGCRRR